MLVSCLVNNVTKSKYMTILKDQFLNFHYTFFVSKDNPGLEENSYELCYNMACYLIGREDYKGAEQKLKKAEGTPLV